MRPILAVAALALGGCAVLPAPAHTIDPIALLETIGPDGARAADGFARLVEPTRMEFSSLHTPPSPIEVLRAANEHARETLGRERFVGATHYFDYAPGALYPLQTAPGFVSTILLAPGERLVDIAAGDTTRWSIAHSRFSERGRGRVVVLVKAKTGALRTNFIVITDQRAYLIEAASAAGETYAAQIAWRYPDEPLSDRAWSEEDNREAAAIASLNFAYRIRTVKGRNPPWRPVRVFDDGRKTWIEFPAGVAARDLPPLFLRTGEGLELVNFRVEPHRYVVDRVFEAAELRIGRRAPIVVRIERERAKR